MFKISLWFPWGISSSVDAARAVGRFPLGSVRNGGEIKTQIQRTNRDKRPSIHFGGGQWLWVARQPSLECSDSAHRGASGKSLAEQGGAGPFL